MAAKKSSKTHQVVQTVLIVAVSGLLTAVLVLTIKNWNKGSEEKSAADEQQVEQEGEKDSVIVDRVLKDTQELAYRLANKDKALNEAIDDKENADKARDGVMDRMVSLRAENNELSQKLSSSATAVADLEEARFEVKTLKKFVQTLQEELQVERDNNDTTKLTQANTLLQHNVADLTGKLKFANLELEKLKKSAQAATATDDSGELEALKAEVIALSTNNAELREKLNALTKKPTTGATQNSETTQETEEEYNGVDCFVEDVTKLSPRMIKLHNSLSHAAAMDLGLAYETIEKHLRVVKLRHVKFAETTSHITELEQGLIEVDLKDSAKTSEIIVVAYTSKDGKAEENKAKAIKRVTATAAAVQKVVGPNQTVKAVFYGATDRFSKQEPAANQICEIWEVKK